MSFDFNAINNSLSAQVTSAQSALTTATQQAGSGNDPAAQMRVLQATQNWQNLVALQSSLVKAMGETIKGIIQKMP